MWDERYGAEEFAYGKEPNDFLKERVGVLPSGGSVLCLAEGEGRNAVYLAKAGHTVTGVDMSEMGLKKVRTLADENGVHVETVLANLMDYDLGEAKWDAVVGIYCHMPPPVRAKVLGAIARALKPGGVFLLEAYTPAQKEYQTGGPHQHPEMCYSLEVLERELAPGLVVEHAQELVRCVVEGLYHTGDGAVVQFIARKSAGQ